MNGLNSILELARKEIGYLEKQSNANLDDKTLNAGSKNYTKYARDFSTLMKVNLQAQAWCAMFVSWLFVQVYGFETAKEILCGNLYASCTMARNAFRTKGKHFTTDPQPGDLVIFNDSKDEIAHIGIVESVIDDMVYTIEGNTSGDVGVVPNGGGVFAKKYYVKYPGINCYLRPDYASFEQIGWINEGSKWKYKLAGGTYVTSSWEFINSKWYYFDGNGIMQTGWLLYKDKWYYLKANGDMASNEVLTIPCDDYGEEIYAFHEEGHMLSLANQTRGSLK